MQDCIDQSRLRAAFANADLASQLGWRQEPGGTISVASVLISALVAFGWAFVTGLLFMSAYVMLRF